MSGPARAGVLIYAKDVEKLSAFYEQVLEMRLLHADAERRVLGSADTQLIVHALPPQLAASVVIPSPPVPRDTQAIKPFFTVASLAEAEKIAEAHGGGIMGPIWPGPGMKVRNVFDPEGNIVHLRERVVAAV